jgi:hypothetical protein
MPSVAWVLEHIEAGKRLDTRPPPEPPTLTPEERKRSDAAAIKSMLWVHYTQGTDAKHIGGIVHTSMARLYAAQFGSDPTEALEAAKQLPGHDRESILAWMDSQKAMGN